VIAAAVGGVREVFAFITVVCINSVIFILIQLFVTFAGAIASGIVTVIVTSIACHRPWYTSGKHIPAKWRDLLKASCWSK